MPVKSKRQARYLAAAEEKGDVPKGTLEKLMGKTPNVAQKKRINEIKKQAMFDGMSIAIDMISRGIVKESSGRFILTDDQRRSLEGDAIKINRVLKSTPTLSMIIREIDRDPRLSRREKDRRKRELMSFKNDSPIIRRKTRPNITSTALGAAGGGLLAYLATKGEGIPGYMKAIIAGGGLIGGGKLFGDLLGMKSPDPTDPKHIESGVSEWKTNM